MNKHVLTVKEVLDAQEKFHVENVRHLHRYVRDTLLPQLELELTRERGLWGPTQPSHLGKNHVVCDLPHFHTNLD
jgi:hypothetical protein